MGLKRLITDRFNIFKLCYDTIWSQYLLIGYPRYTPQELAEEIYKPNVPENELNLFRRFSTGLKASQVALVALSLVAICKNLTFPIYTLAQVNSLRSRYSHLGDLKANLNKTNPIQYGCLWTNCSKLSPNNRLFDDIVALPVYKLCFPAMHQYVYPVLDNNLSAVAMQTVGMFFAFMFVVFLPIILYLKPLNHEVGMFIIAPQTLHRSNCEKAREFLLERLRSIENYFFESKQKIPNLVADNDVTKPAKSALASEQLQRVHMNKDSTQLHKNVQDFIEDCIPFGRHLDYRYLLAKQCIIFVVVLGYYFSLWTIGDLLGGKMMSDENEAYLAQMDQFIDSSGCAIWQTDDRNSNINSNDLDDCNNNNAHEVSNGGGNNCNGAGQSSKFRMVRVSEPRTKWNLYTMLEYPLMYSPTTYIMTVSCALTFAGFQEIYIELAQQKDRLQVAIDMTELLVELGAPKRSKTSGFNLELDDDDDVFKRLRRLHIQSMASIFGMRYLQALRDRKTNYSSEGGPNRNLLRELSKDSILRTGANLDIYLNVHIKAYIGNRMLTGMIRKASQNVAFILMYCHLCNYGCALIVGYINKRFGAKDYGSFVLGIIAFMVTNTMVATSAEVQARSKCLMAQMWQLIAATCEFKDMRIKHMRSLWIKQVVALGHENGMPYKLLNVPITYQSLIEIIIWSTTLALLSIN